ncbi:diguanylate cyclase (GGDEF)-like protein [Methylohalomonas lacus]|uniref:diguanylate cyclase n=1 Tax=Methylohalomonas lacus TaxID=398773 RepID=A0AAE3HI61_9GAMM|nr:sensor domain-containing diguanylate cyclase [Methylohalomonas lacus]MCS3902749.1 diguanylate cyclase (GGDEF)-like protein [Methylohalomonas lacus]
MLSRKIYFAAALAVLLIIGFMATSLISYFVAHDSMSDYLAEETLPLTSDNIYSEIRRDLLRSILISSLMAHDTFVRDWTLSGEENPEAIVRYLSEIRQKHETITAFFVSDRTRNYYHPDGIIKQVDADDPADSWYFRIREMNDPYEINIDNDTADRQRVNIFINYRVNDYQGNFIGVTGIGLSVDAVADLIASYQKRYGRQIYFVDRDGKVVLNGTDFSGPRQLHERAGIGRHATQVLTSPGMSFTYQRPDGHTIHVNTRLISEFDWYLVVEQDEHAAETRIRNTLIANILVSLAITILVLTVAHFMVRGYQRRLEEMATTDKLTGAANRQVFDMIFDHVIKTARRRNEAVTLITLDIDHFKEVNDNHGHQAGDQVIRQIADVIRQHTRDTDTLCRWGGEEFLLLLSDCSLANARERAESIRAAINSEIIQVGNHAIGVTVSLGLAEYRHNEDMATFISRADKALYAAKSRGRDQVQCAD